MGKITQWLLVLWYISTSQIVKPLNKSKYSQSFFSGDNVIQCEIKTLKITNNQSEARMSLDNPWMQVSEIGLYRRAPSFKMKSDSYWSSNPLSLLLPDPSLNNLQSHFLNISKTNTQSIHLRQFIKKYIYTNEPISASLEI